MWSKVPGQWAFRKRYTEIFTQRCTRGPTQMFWSCRTEARIKMRFTGVKFVYPWGRQFKRVLTCARCFNVDHCFAKLMTTAAIGLAQFGIEDT
jgi:hypothetical protein